MKKIITVVGARPQFVKAATVSRVIREHGEAMGLCELIVHTGQHYDEAMSQVFFDQLDIPRPRYNLGYGGGRHGEMTGRMLAGIEQVLLDEKPDLLLVYGDTNSTLAGALAAAKLHVPVAHVEAGLRSFNMRMPEEVNRILTDRVSSLLFCPTVTAVENLGAEGVAAGVYNVGDVMFDASLHYRDMALRESRVLGDLGLDDKCYVLATCHRAENTDDPGRLAGIMAALNSIARDMPVVFPLHPRTRATLHSLGLSHCLEPLRVTDPLSYLDMLALEQGARAIVTDSGGVQKEAFFYGVPCLTLRDETEWAETVDAGLNQLCGADADQIMAAWRGLPKDPGAVIGGDVPGPYGKGDAALQVAKLLAAWQPA